MSSATLDQFLFIDSRVDNIESLLDGIDPSIEVILLDSERDGLGQIADALASRSGVKSVHVISHGGPGSLQLGSSTVTESSLADQAAQLATIRAALSDSADLMLYGCNVAEGDAGASFVQALADATGADVAASTDTTGSALLGGDWALEASTGSIETQAIEVSAYSSTLGADSQLPSGLTGSGPWTWGGKSFQTRYDGEITDSDPENPLRAGNKWDRYALSGVTAGTTVYVYMGNSSTIDDYLQIDRNGTIVTQNDDGGDGERSYDAYVTWTYQVGDVIRATTYSSGYRGTYSLFIGTSAGTAPTATDIGSAPPPAPPAPTAPTFSDGITSLSPYADTGTTDTASGLGTRSGTFTASDTTPTGTLTYSGGGVGTYGTLGVASGGSFTYTPNATVINALAAGASVSDSFTVTVSDGGLSSSKSVTVNLTGANDAPTLSGNATLAAIAEDTGATNAANPGRSVSALFGGLFADVDNGASLGGIVIVGNAADAGTQGRWQYSTDNGSTWHDVGVVSTSAGLTLSAGSKLHFVPVANYAGTPGSLTVHGTDNSFVGTYTSGASRVTFDTTADALTSGVSVASQALGTSVTAVNDAPVFTSAPGAATLTETSAADAGVTTASGSLSGTLTASDVDDVSGLSFSIRGGSGSGTLTKDGFYGTLTLDAASGAWSFAPTNFTAINALAQGASATETFEFKVTDSHGAASTQNLVITLTGTNDVPLLASTIADQSFSGAGTWTYQIPAASFTDAEGTGLTYTATLADDSPLPGWLSFVEGTRTFSGNPPANWADAGLSIKVTATDGSGEAVSDTFTLTLSNTANQPPVVASPLTWQAVDAPTEVTQVTFGSTLGGTTLTFDGQTLTLGSAASDADVASAVLTAFASGSTNFTAAAGGLPNEVIFTAKVAGARTDVSDVVGAGTYGTLGGGSASGFTVTTPGADAVAEVVTVSFNDNSSINETAIDFDGLSVTLNGSEDAAGVATAVLNAAQSAGGGSTNWLIAAAGGPGADLTFTARVAGSRTDLSANEFESAPAIPSGLVSVAAPSTQGANAVAEVFKVTYSGAYGGSTLVFDGITATAGAAVSAADVAKAVGETVATVTSGIVSSEWNRADGGDGVFERVTFTIASQPSWAAGATVTLTLPRYDTGDANDVYTLTTAALPASPTGAQIADAIRTAALATPGSGITSGVKTVNADGDGVLGDLGDYGFGGADGSADLSVFMTDPTNDWPNLPASLFTATVGMPNVFTNHSVTSVLGDTVTFTSNTPGVQADITGASFTGTYIDTGSTITPTITTQGAGWTYAIPAGTFTDPENDTLTYSAYTVDPSTGVATLLSNTAALSFNPATATLSGNGTAPASTLIEIRATDGNHGPGYVASQFQLVVYNDTQAASLVAGVVPASVTFVGGAGSGSAALPVTAFNYLDTSAGSLSYSATLANDAPLPAWLHFDTSTGVFTGNPPDGASSVSVKVTATDGTLSATTGAFTLSITSPNDPLVLSTPIADQAVAAGNPVSVSVPLPFTNPDGNADGSASTAGITYTATANGQPLSDFGLTLGTSGGNLTLSGNPPAGTPYLNILVTGTEDAGGTTATTSFTLNLADPSASTAATIGALGANNAGAVTISGTPTQGQTLTANAPTDADGVATAPSYQWQVSADGSTWADIAGARGQGSTLTLAQSESQMQVRVQAFYVDNGGVAEAPVSTAVSVADLPDAGTISISGSLAPDQILSAALVDADGLVAVTPAYQWQVSADGVGGWSNISGATYSTYTLTNADGGKYFRVQASYTDNMGNVETNVTSAATGRVILGAVAPVAVNDTNAVTEQGGVNNATGSATPITGNVRTNDTDANSDISPSMPITALRTGSVEGVGEPATDDGTTLTVDGLYGTLVLTKATGAYSYTLHQGNSAVQALAPSDHLTDVFNYSVIDSTNLSDNGLLSITINGADDEMTIADLPTSVDFSEDLAAELATTFLLVDPDSASSAVALRFEVSQGTLRASGNDSLGVTVTGSDTGVMIASGTSLAGLQNWLSAGGIYFRSAPNDNDGAGTPAATIALGIDSSANLASPGLNVYVPSGTINVNLTAVNDAPIVDLGGSSSAGNDFVTTFRPRGSAVAVVSDTVAITDIDSANLQSATVTLASGADDNQFGTTFETLFSSYSGSLALTGNGTGTNGLTDATELTFTGSADAAEYQAALRSVFYLNANPNAAAGDRTITVSLSDGALDSNLASFTTASANTDIAVGQRIYIGGVDSGQTVAVVGSDHIHFVASGPIPGLASNAALTFYAAGSLVTSAIQTGPVIATTTVLVPWTPVIDMNGDLVDGASNTVTFTEGGAAVALATADASITDQGGLIRTLTLTLTNPLDNSPGNIKEYLVAPSGAVAAALAARGITASGNGTGTDGLTGATEIVFTSSAPGGTDATNFQIALRGVKYINTDDAPDTTQRIVNASTLDSNSLSGVGAQAFINLTPTNDAPIGSAHTVSATEDTPYVFSTGDFPFSDATDGGANSLQAVKITTLPATGTLTLDGTPVTAGQTVLASDIAAGHLVYTPVLDASGAGAASFTFQVQDDGGTAHGGVDLATSAATLTIDLAAANDAPLVTVPATIGVTEDVASALTGIVFADVDAASGSVVATLSVPSGTLAATSGSGVTVGGSASALTLAGSLANINAFIAASGVTYTTASNALAPVTLTVALNDGGNTGSGGSLGVLTTLTLDVTAVNDAPTITVPGTQTVAEEGSLTISGISFGDVDADNGNVSVTLTVGHGTLTLGGDASGVTLTAGADNSTTMTLSGTLAAVNAAVTSLGYVPDTNFSGTDSLQLAIDDGGNSGTGTALDASTSLTLTVTGANDAPVLTAGSPQLGVISDEDSTSSIGYAVQDFVGSGAGKTGISDVDVPVDAEFAGQGIAIHAVSTSGPGAGTWEYQVGAGPWTSFTLSPGMSLLLAATDHIRFVPDGLNATTATFSYYLWDGASGSAGSQVDASTRGSSTAFSTGSDTATLTVTPVNDAPVVDLNGSSPGTGGSAEFKPRGDAVQVISADVRILDPDSGDQITGATVTLDPDAIDNQFGTLYETLSSSYSGSLTVAGNGTGANGLTGATQITLSGLASAAVYEAALQTITYTNSNPNAYAGMRNVFVTVHDDASTTAGTGAASSAISTVQLAVNWSPVVDLNGSSVSDSNADGIPDRNFRLSYQENAGAIAIAASDAFILDQDGNLKTVTVTLTNPLDGSAESLFVDASPSYLSSLGIAASVSLDGHTVTFSGNRDGTAFQVALRAVKYLNTSENPDTSTARQITVNSVDQADHTGLAATTFVTPVRINDAPTSANATVTLEEDTVHTFQVSDFPFSDTDANALLAVRIQSLPAHGLLKLDGVTLVVGDLPIEVSATDIAGGLLTYTPDENANDTLSGAADSFGFKVIDNGGSALGGTPVSAASYTLTLSVTPVNDLPVPNPPTVTVSGNAQVGQVLTAQFQASDADYAGSGLAPFDYQWQSRSLPAGSWVDITGATNATYTLDAAEANKEVRVQVVYHDTVAAPITVNSASATDPLIVVAANGSLTIDLTSNDPGNPPTVDLPPGTIGPVVITNNGTTPVTVTGLTAPTTVTTGGSGPLVISNPTGNVGVTNNGTGTTSVTGVDDGATVTTGGTGPTTVSDPLGDVTIANAGPGTTTVTGATDGSTVSTSGAGPTTVSGPLGDVNIANAGPGTTTVTGATDGSTVTTSGSGPTTVSGPLGDVTIANAGPGTTTVSGATDGSTVSTSGNGPTSVSDPLGDVTIANAGPGTTTVSGATDGSTVSTSGAGPTTVSGPLGDVTIDNAGPGVTTVTGATDGSTVATSGNGPTTVSDPLGNVSIDNAGPGTTTVSGANNGSTVITSGAGPTTVSDPDGSLAIVNNGTGTTTVTGANDGSTISTGGSGPTTVSDPDGSIAIVNAGPGTTTVTGANNGSVVTTSGNGPTTVSDPDGSLVIVNAGPGTTTVTGANDGSSITTVGTGPTTVSDPDGNVAILNIGPGTTTVTGANAGSTVTTSGPGSTTIGNPDGDVTIANAGPGTTTVTGATDGSTVTTSGAGPTTVSNPAGDLSVSNTGTGLATVSGAADGATITTSGPVTLASPVGNLTLAGDGINTVTSPAAGSTLTNNGSGTTTVSGVSGSLGTAGTGTTVIDAPAANAVISDTGSGPLSVNNPAGDLSLSNAGGGSATVNGAADGSTITTSGPVTLANPAGDLTLAGDGSNTVTGLAGVLSTTGSGPTTVSAPLAGATVRNSGTGALSIVDPASLTVHNDSSSPVSISSPADNAVLTLTGSGPVSITAPDDDLAIDNMGTGLASVSGLANGASLSIAGNGPVAVSSSLPAGESITLDTTHNGNVTLSNTGAGQIHVQGDLDLDAADPMTVVLQGDGTTSVTLAGSVELANTPLNLSLAAGYNPSLSDTITLLDNDGSSDPVVGTFAGLDEGATLLVGGETFRISYRGGDGNNVVLTRVNATASGSVSISGTPIQNAVLTASNTLVDADGLGTVTYKWMDGSTQLGTGSQYILQPGDVGHNIRVDASYTDGEGTVETVASQPTTPIINVNDAPTGGVTISGTPEQGQTLSVASTLADLDGLGTLSFQWLANGQAIAGATGTSLQLGTAQVGKVVTVEAAYVDGHGTAESVTSAGTAAINVVSSVAESTAPSLSGGTAGDGNGDGISDAIQSAVVSAPVTATGGSAGSSFLTLVADSSAGKVNSGSTVSVTEFAQTSTTAPSNMPVAGSAPLGTIGFTAETDTVSGLENFSLYVNANLGVNGYWVQGAGGTLVNLASEAYGGRMVVEGDKLRLDFQVADGSSFDLDGGANGSVQLDGAVGYVPMSLISYTPDTPDTNTNTNAPIWD